MALFGFLSDATTQASSRLSTDVIGNITATVVATIISSSISIIVIQRQLRSADRSSLDRHTDELLKIAIEYPELEDKEFISRWSKSDLTSAEEIRYASYCCHVHNLVYRVWLHCKGKRGQMCKIIFYDELLRSHRAWWLSDAENQSAYEPKFVHFVNTFNTGN